MSLDASSRPRSRIDKEHFIMQRKKTIYLLAVLALLVSMLPLGAAAQGGPSAPFGIQEYAPSDNKALDGTGASGAALPLAPEGMSLYVETEPNETVTVEVQGPSIELRKTVGTDPGACATTDEITLPVGGGDVTYCYAVDNTGDVTLNLHDLDDSELGNLFSGLNYALMPGASAFVTETTTIDVTTVNAATWTAYNAGGPSVQATGVATVTVEVQGPSIELRKTVGTDPGACATTDEITLPVGGGDVTYCYAVDNTGNVTLNLHDLDDSELGNLFSGLNYALMPGASAFVTETTTIDVTTVNAATWTAYNAGGPSVQATGVATVTVEVQGPSIELRKTVGTDPGACATTDEITLPVGGGDVTYCYAVDNTGNVTLNLHDLDDSELGNLFSGLTYALMPGASAFVTETTTIAVTTVNAATWTAYNAGGPSVQATDVATVTVEVQGPSIELRKTVGTDPGACATTDEITLPVAGSDVTYCYEVENTGDITLNLHDLDDSELGSILSGFSYALAPGASVFLTQTTPINVTTVNTATWTAYNAGGPRRRRRRRRQ
jgi:N-acyl-L-homoserine lactone synthetase